MPGAPVAICSNTNPYPMDCQIITCHISNGSSSGFICKFDRNTIIDSIEAESLGAPSNAGEFQVKYVTSGQSPQTQGVVVASAATQTVFQSLVPIKFGTTANTTFVATANIVPAGAYLCWGTPSAAFGTMTHVHLTIRCRTLTMAG